MASITKLSKIIKKDKIDLMSKTLIGILLMESVIYFFKLNLKIKICSKGAFKSKILTKLQKSY